MINVLSVENMRKSDSACIKAGTPGTELMMRAAKGVFGSVTWRANVAIVCGSGNNAGDGYALALLLHEAGIECCIFCVYDRFSDDGKFYFDKCKEAGIRTEMWSDDVDLSGYAMIADCLLGTGFGGRVRPELEKVIDAINQSDAFTVSVDINSGLSGVSGLGEKCVISQLTVSVGSFKPGHFLNMAKDVMEDKVNVDIGIKPVDSPYMLIESSDILPFLGKRSNMSNKGTYGYCALIGGSMRYSGAIRLAYMSNAAMRSGAGVVKVALPSSLSGHVISHILESTLFPLTDNDGEVSYVAEEIDELISNVKTVAFGMGIGTGDGAAGILLHLLSNFKGTLVIDADGLNLLAKLDRSVIKNCKADIVLTPHIKEFSRLTGLDIDEIQNDPIGHAMEYAQNTGVTLLLKGPATVVTDGIRVFISDAGCPGMATAGSGDVLSGILAAVASFAKDAGGNRDACLAAAVAAYINGEAGVLASKEYGDISMTAHDTAAFIPQVLKDLSDKEI